MVPPPSSERIVKILAIMVVLIGATLSAIGLVPAARAELPPIAEHDPTVRALLPGCQSLVATYGVPTTREAAFCSGMIDSLIFLGELLPPHLCYAVPLDVPRHRVIQTIVEEMLLEAKRSSPNTQPLWLV